MALARIPAALVLGLSIAGATVAQQFPDRPIRIIATDTPGGAPDVIARVVGSHLSQTLKQPVVVETRPGANGNIAGSAVIGSSADGYTLLLAPDSLIVINPNLFKMPFDPAKAFVPVGTVASSQLLLLVNPSLPVATLAEFVDYARRANPPMSYGSVGQGSLHHLSMEMFKARTGINLVHVPYRGAAPAIIAVVSGEIPTMFAGASSAPLIKSGKLRALGATGSRPPILFPDLPKFSDSFPGFEINVWLALFAPAGTPQPAIVALREALGKALEDADVRQKLGNIGGLVPYKTSPEEFRAIMDRDLDKYRKIVQSIGLRLE